MVCLHQVEVCLRCVLRPLVTVECKSTSDLFSFQSLTDGVCNQGGRHISADLPRKDGLSTQIQHSAHVPVSYTHLDVYKRQELALHAIDATVEWFRALGLPVNLTELLQREITDDMLRDMALTASYGNKRKFGKLRVLDCEDMYNIYKGAIR